MLQIYGAMHFEDVHPQQCGYLRLKDRKRAAAGAAARVRALFYPQYAWETLVKYARFAAYGWKIHRMRKRLEKDPDRARTTAISPRPRSSTRKAEHLEMFELNDSARAAVEKAKKQAEQRKAAREEPRTRRREVVHIEAAE